MKLSRYFLALFFVMAGAAHFVSLKPYLAITPVFVPWPETMVYLSGIAEVVGGIGVLIGRTRRAAGVGLIAFLIAVFPANVYAALHGMSIAGWDAPGWLLWVRLPLQALLVWWVYCTCRKEP